MQIYRFVLPSNLSADEDICALYETATQKNPKSEELLIGLFNSYVRTENFAKQKEVHDCIVSVDHFKDRHETLQTIPSWALFAVVYYVYLTAGCFYLCYAYRSGSCKWFSRNSIAPNFSEDVWEAIGQNKGCGRCALIYKAYLEALSIYLFILEQQNQYQEIIKLLTTNTKLIALYKVEAERKQYIATTHLKVQQFQEANALFKDLLETNK